MADQSSYGLSAATQREFSRFNYDAHLQTIKDLFSRLHVEPPADNETPVWISLEELQRADPALVDCICSNFPHYKSLICQVLSQAAQDAGFVSGPRGAPDLAETGLPPQPVFSGPQRLLRGFDVFLEPPRSILESPSRFRDVSASSIGHLSAFRATVTFLSQVIPECEVATFVCEECRASQYLVVPSDNFTPPKRCVSQECKAAQRFGTMVFSGSRSAVNSLRVAVLQELASEIPDGEVPRTMTVHVRGEGGPRDASRGAAGGELRPGDNVLLWGTLMPIPTEGSIFQIEPVFYAEHWRLLADVRRETPLSSLLAQASALGARNLLDLLRTGGDVMTLLTRSFAPNIHGRENEKLSCLCSIVGGSSVNLPDIKLRGNVNLLLAGDPGVAKSQLLRFACGVCERAVYVAGRGASGAGLTAAAIRVPNTNDFSLEGGALVIADRGVCCIDEFDKLTDEDRTCIYEVLEQGTISVSKAGITATLNARTTVMAAANPRYSRWDPSLSVKDNLNLPEALISRFDIIFVIRDKIDNTDDTELAQHVAQLHMATALPGASAVAGEAAGDARVEDAVRASGQREAEDTQGAGENAGDDAVSASGNRQAAASAPPVAPALTPAEVSQALFSSALDADTLREVLTRAREITPRLTRDLIQRFVDCYVQDRRERFYVTPRALLSTIRLSQAVAKLRLSQTVTLADVDVARELLSAAEESVRRDVTGRVDMLPRSGDYLSGQDRRKASIIKEAFASFPQGATEQELRQRSIELGLEEREFSYFLRVNLLIGVIRRADNGSYLLR